MYPACGSALRFLWKLWGTIPASSDISNLRPGRRSTFWIKYKNVFSRRENLFFLSIEGSVMSLSCSYKTENIGIGRSRRNKIVHPLINISILHNFFTQMSCDLAKISRGSV
jgi:hypothetical protein